MDDSTSNKSANKKKIYIKRTASTMTQSASRRYTTPTSSVERSPFKTGCVIGIGIICGFFAIIIGIFFLGIMGTSIALNFGSSSDDARNTDTRTAIGTIDQAIQIYRMKTGYLPKSLNDLTVRINGEDPLLPHGILQDAWGNSFHYKVIDKKYTITSAGADGRMGSLDDITN